MHLCCSHCCPLLPRAAPATAGSTLAFLLAGEWKIVSIHQTDASFMAALWMNHPVHLPVQTQSQAHLSPSSPV